MTDQSALALTHGVFLDMETYASDRIDLSALRACLDDWTIYERTSPAEIAPRLQDAQVLVTNKALITRDILEAAPALKLIVVGATGVNNIDLDAARDLGLRVCNIRGYSTPSVVQHVFAFILALATRLPAYHAAVQSGAWAKNPFFCLLDYPVVEIAGKTIGIVGYGDLGHAVEHVARAFGMEVLIAERKGAGGEERRDGRLPFEEVLSRADIVTVHCPLSEDTRGLIGEKELAQMKKSAFLINTARGGIVDEAALAQALRTGTIAGAGIDVLSKEPPSEGNPLLAADIPNLLITPHTAWASNEAIQRLMDQIAETILAFKSGQPRNIVV
ncbi:MAG: 2-hydroxyacid dehydrogenase [Alphaproteobacteria bacterium]|nr:2-hydroxyacid dehydrogenase [Alphaproteobacteria bacterium]